MFRCTTDRYEELYAKWLGNPGLLLDLAGYDPQERLLDLCGGSGVVTQEALRRGAVIQDILLYDLNPRSRDPRVSFHRGDLNKDAKEHRYLDSTMFDVIVIRQAANYLKWDQELVAWLQYHLVPGGRLVFNSFIHPMSGGVKSYSTKSYTFGGQRFFEAHLFIPPFDEWFRKEPPPRPPDRGPCQGTVLHLQSKLSRRKGFDITKFNHLDPPALSDLLSPRFLVDMQKDGRSIRWVCFKHRPSFAGGH